MVNIFEKYIPVLLSLSLSRNGKPWSFLFIFKVSPLMIIAVLHGKSGLSLHLLLRTEEVWVCSGCKQNLEINIQSQLLQGKTTDHVWHGIGWAQPPPPLRWKNPPGVLNYFHFCFMSLLLTSGKGWFEICFNESRGLIYSFSKYYLNFETFQNDYFPRR